MRPCQCICGKRAHVPLIPVHLLQDFSTAASKKADVSVRLLADQTPRQVSESTVPGKPRRQSLARGNKRTQKHTKLDSIDISQSNQAWEAYAAGGHREADARLREEARTAAMEAEKKRLDEDTARALFGPTVTNSGGSNSKDDADESVGTAGGDMPKKRKSRKTVWTPLHFREASHHKETSLLDLD